MGIHWFPGHMAKTRRLITESLKQVDGIIHLADARLPEGSQNPLLYELAGSKPMLLVLAKADLADPVQTNKWLRRGEALAVSLKDNKTKGYLLDHVHTNLERSCRKRFIRPWRVMVVGIPNVGKSTLINLLAGRRAASVGNRPGITRVRQWIKISAGMEMLDTPGILWPKLGDKESSLRLAAVGCIRDEVLPLQEVAKWLLAFLKDQYPESLSHFPGTDLTAVAKKMGTMTKGGSFDLERGADLLLRDFRSGRLGRITLETQ